MLSDINHNNVKNIYGNKANSLNKLIALGYKAPNGFVISTWEYANFLKKNNLFNFIKKQINNANLKSIESLNSVYKEISIHFAQSNFSNKVQDQVSSFIKNLSSKKFAIRSSSSYEDMPDASFAGQYNTYLNVSIEDIFSKIKLCYSSLYKPGAIMYRNIKRIPIHVEMAVIIQEMIQPEFAGILFTVSPQKRNCLVIELASGLGEKVVSGSVSPNRYYINRENYKLICLEEKEHFDQSYLKMMVTMALDIEKKFNYPQDIEFAIKNNNIYILQSRNITSL